MFHLALGGGGGRWMWLVRLLDQCGGEAGGKSPTVECLIDLE